MGPGEDSAPVLRSCEYQLAEQSSYLGDGPRNQLVTNILFFVGELLLLRTTAKNACANIDNVI